MKQTHIYRNLFGSILLWIVVFASVGKGIAQEASVQRSRPLMGTLVEIIALGADHSICDRAVEKAFEEIEAVDAIMSNFRENSQLSQLNRLAGTSSLVVHPQLLEVLDSSVLFSHWTRGAFDVTVSPLLNLWGFYRENGQVPSAEELGQTLSLVNYRNLRLDRKEKKARLQKPGMAVDLGGVAKGYAVDKATEALRRNGILQGLINAGGDLYALGRPKEEDFWLIGLQHPLKNKGMAGFIQVEDQAVATSGNYEKYFLIQGKKYTHIIDPRTGWPVKGMASVTVLADSVIKADALATAVFVMGVKEGLKLLNGLPGVEGVLITEEEKNGKEEFSPFLSEGLQGKLKFELP